MIQGEYFEKGLRRRLSGFVDRDPGTWRGRTNLIKHTLAEWGREEGFRVHYKIERDPTGQLNPQATSESPYNLDLAWSIEPVDIYDHANLGQAFGDAYKVYGGVVLAMESEWAQYGVGHDPDLRLRSMVKDFRKLVWTNAVHKLFVYCSIYPEEVGASSKVLHFFATRLLAHSPSNGTYYFAEYRANATPPDMPLYRYDSVAGNFFAL